MDKKFPIPERAPQKSEIDPDVEEEWERRDSQGIATMGQINDDLGIVESGQEPPARSSRIKSTRKRPPTPSERSRPGYDKVPFREDTLPELSEDQIVINAARAEVSLAIRQAGSIDAYIAQDPANNQARLVRLGLVENDPSALK